MGLANLVTNLKVVVPFNMAMRNPLGVPVRVTKLWFDIIHKNVTLMTLHTETYMRGQPLNIVLQPYAFDLSLEVPIVAVMQMGPVGDLLKLFFNTLWDGIVFVD